MPQNPNQEALLRRDHYGIESPVVPVSPVEVQSQSEVSVDPEGTYMSVIDHEDLIPYVYKALEFIATRNSTRSLVNRITNDPTFRQRVGTQRYNKGKGTISTQVNQGKESVRDHTKLAKRSLQIASGWAALKASGVFPESHIDEKIVDEWSEFNFKFGGPDYKGYRKAERSRLVKRYQEKSKRREAKKFTKPQAIEDMNSQIHL